MSDEVKQFHLNENGIVYRIYIITVVDNWASQFSLP